MVNRIIIPFALFHGAQAFHTSDEAGASVEKPIDDVELELTADPMN